MAIIKIRGSLVDMLLYIPPDVYGPYVTMNIKGTNQFITQCMNDTNGNMMESLIYYCIFLKTSKINKFKMNPYDPCVSNRMINRLQQLILFNVEYCKLSHKDTKVNDSFIGLIR